MRCRWPPAKGSTREIKVTQSFEDGLSSWGVRGTDITTFAAPVFRPLGATSVATRRQVGTRPDWSARKNRQRPRNFSGDTSGTYLFALGQRSSFHPSRRAVIPARPDENGAAHPACALRAPQPALLQHCRLARQVRRPCPLPCATPSCRRAREASSLTRSS